MSLTLLAVAAAIAAGAGYVAARRRYRAEALADEAAGGAGAAGAAEGQDTSKKVAEPSAFAGLPLDLGDVISADGEERWLAGALVAREDTRVVSALFLAPEGGSLHAIAAFAAPRREIYWLAPAGIECPETPPATLEIDGESFARRGRLPVTVDRLGQGAPHLGETALWATYEAGGRDVALVIVSAGKAYCWKGRRLDEGEYDRLGKGGVD
jgi:hypothetical protein